MFRLCHPLGHPLCSSHNTFVPRVPYFEQFPVPLYRTPHSWFSHPCNVEAVCQAPCISENQSYQAVSSPGAGAGAAFERGMRSARRPARRPARLRHGLRSPPRMACCAACTEHVYTYPPGYQIQSGSANAPKTSRGRRPLLSTGALGTSGGSGLTVE